MCGRSSIQIYLNRDPARDRAQEIIVAARRGEDLTLNLRKGEPTFREVWRTMIEEVDKPKLSAVTIADYEDRADRLILPRLGDKLIGDVTTADVEKAVAAATGARNRAYIATLIKKTVNYAKRARILPDSYRNPAADVSVKKEAKKGRALETDDIARFGKALAEMEGEGKVSPWLANLLRLSLVCGLRPGEVRTLEWSRVNFAAPQDDGHRENRRSRGRPDRGRRDDFGSKPARPGMRIRLRRPPVRRADRCGLQGAEARTGPRGRRRFHPYDLRHSAATGALAAGADVRAVQALLGHADLATTAGYLHSTDSRRRGAAELAARFERGVMK